jgi:hypothetical protein
MLHKFIMPALFVISSSSALAGNYQLSFREFGSGRSDAECSQAIKLAAEQFGAQAGVVVLGADCLDAEIGHRSKTGAISYVAATPVSITSSYPGPSYGPSGYYSSRAACVAGMLREVEVFKEQTGLTPFSQYCFQGLSSSISIFQARIDAVGTSEIRKFATHSSWNPTLADPQQYLRDVQEMAEQSGLKVVESIITRDIGGWQIGLGYYFAKEMRLHSEEALSWETEEECQEAISESQQNWSANLKLVFACGQSSRKFQAVYSWFSEEIGSESEFDVQVFPIAYQSIEACRSDRQRVEQALVSSGTQVYASICGLEGTKPRLMAFLAKPIR